MEAVMKQWMRVSVSAAAGLMLWTGAAFAQGQPAGAAQQSPTPPRVEGQVVRIDAGSGKVTVRGGDGTMHEFQASAETLKDLKVGDRIEAKLRQ
jgi:Cu/Ag efflux protein CusF